MYGYGNLGYGPMAGWGFGWIFMIIFWVLVIWAIFAVVRALGGKGGCCHNMHKEDEALKILRERYAKGEISKEEFEQRKNDLSVK